MIKWNYEVGGSAPDPDPKGHAMKTITVKLTDAQAKFILNRSGRLHHMVAKALQAKGLMDKDTWFTGQGEIVAAMLADTPDERTFEIADREDLADAVLMVIEDQRKSYPDMTEGEAVAHAQNTLHLTDIDGEDELAMAYRLMLTRWGATRELVGLSLV